MKRAHNKFQKFVKPLASLKLAVFVILAIGVVSAWGTIVESMYNDAKRAQELVYHSWYSYSVFALLTINLVAVIIDRYPWKKHHMGFIAAHVGIILLIFGSILTRYFGIDGSMAFGIRESKSIVTVAPTDVIVYSGLLSGGARKVFEKEVHFLSDTPTSESPYTIEVGNDKISIDDFRPYTIAQNKIESSDKPTDGPALRFQIANDRVSEADWLQLGSQDYDVKNMGPARIVLSKKGKFTSTEGNLLLIEFDENNKDSLTYKVFTASQASRVKKGKLRAGGFIETGWMGLTFRVLKYIPQAKETWTYEPLVTSTAETIPAIRFEFNGKKYWTGLNSSVRLFSDEAFYVFVYANRQLQLDFALRLNEFRVGRYQGTMRAASYESDVTVMQKQQEGLSTTISMNKPLYYKGFTFYQSSFQEDETGRPVASILSVNQDPGRLWKYLGSLMIVFGIIHLFYFRQRQMKS